MFIKIPELNFSLAKIGAVLTTIALTACGGGGGGSSSPSPTVTATATPTMTATPMPTMTATPTPTATPTTEIKTVVLGFDSVLGNYLKAGNDAASPRFALYTFDNDEPNVSNCTGGCATNWPPFTIAPDTTPVGPSNVTGLGTITRDDSSIQVTLNGQPLYYFLSDTSETTTAGADINLWSLATVTDGIAAKFMPNQDNRVLIFAGQDNQTVGGNGAYTDGYVENVGLPSGITHYISYQFPTAIGGLSTETNWNAGPMHLKAYTDSATLDGTIMHIAIDMVGAEDQVASGAKDHQITELADFLIAYSDTPFLIRIGYEFDNPSNNYDPENFKAAWIRIVDMLRDAGATNFATMLHSLTLNTLPNTWNAYYPGDNYVDWLGYSYFGGNFSDNASSHRFAREVGKPLCICEASPVTHDLMMDDGNVAWNNWFMPLFNHIESNSDIIKALAYINTDWPSQGLWANNNFFNTTDARIQENTVVRDAWLAKMAEDRYVHTNTGVYALIDFNP